MFQLTWKENDMTLNVAYINDEDVALAKAVELQRCPKNNNIELHTVTNMEEEFYYSEDIDDFGNKADDAYEKWRDLNL